MKSPIDTMIDSVVRCVKCGAKVGECDCWEKKEDKAMNSITLVIQCYWCREEFIFSGIPLVKSYVQNVNCPGCQRGIHVQSDGRGMVTASRLEHE